LMDGETPEYTLADVKEEFDRSTLPIDVDEVLKQDNPVLYLVQEQGLSDRGLESFIEILFYSDLEEQKKAALLSDALSYLDGKGYFSFKLHSLTR